MDGNSVTEAMRYNSGTMMVVVKVRGWVESLLLFHLLRQVGLFWARAAQRDHNHQQERDLVLNLFYFIAETAAVVQDLNMQQTPTPSDSLWQLHGNVLQIASSVCVRLAKSPIIITDLFQRKRCQKQSENHCLHAVWPN